MSNYTDEAEEVRAVYQRQSSARGGLSSSPIPGKSASRLTSSDSTVFAMQIGAMQELQQRVYNYRYKLQGVADQIRGPLPPEKGTEQVSPTPTTVEQSWQTLCEEVERLGREIDRFYI